MSERKHAVGGRDSGPPRQKASIDALGTEGRRAQLRLQVGHHHFHDNHARFLVKDHADQSEDIGVLERPRV